VRLLEQRIARRSASTRIRSASRCRLRASAHSVLFVVETTGRPSFVVSGLLAAAELMMGASSMSDYQIDHGPLDHVIAGHRPA
jgi:hypothetical protein